MESKSESRIQFLFLFPIFVLFCAYFLPLAKIASYTVFRGVELYDLYLNWPDYTPPASGYGLLVWLFMLIPPLAAIGIVLSALGSRLTAFFSFLYSAFILALTLGLLFPGYQPLVQTANPEELGLPLPRPGLGTLLGEGYIGLGYMVLVVVAALLLVYSLHYMATRGASHFTVSTEGAIYDSIRKNLRQYMMIIALLGIWGIFYVLTENGVFITARNLSNLFLQSASTAVVATCVVLILVTMNIDLSIGSVVGFIGAVAAVAQTDSPLAKWIASFGFSDATIALIAIGISILIGLAIGAWHGWWIAYQGVPAFIVTLSSMMVFRGGILAFTGGKSIYNMKRWFQAIGQDYVSPDDSKWVMAAVILLFVVFELRRRFVRQRYGFPVASWPVQILKLVVACAAIAVFFYIMILYRGVPYAWLIVLVVMVILTFIAEKTTFGRHLYAIGGNPEAARLSGINIRRKIMYLYLLMGVVTAIGGIIFLARLNAATAQAGNGMELDCIASAVIGGTSLMGGEGLIFGGVVGALVMGSLDNGMSLMNLDVTWQYIVKGLVLLLAVWVDMINRKRGN